MSQAGLFGRPGPATPGTETADPGATGPAASPADVDGTWLGTWTQDVPDPASGALRLEIVRGADGIEGEVTLTGNACFATGRVRGTVDGAALDLANAARDEVAFEGTVDGNRITGTYSMACDLAQGTFELERGGPPRR